MRPIILYWRNRTELQIYMYKQIICLSLSVCSDVQTASLDEIHRRVAVSPQRCTSSRFFFLIFKVIYFYYYYYVVMFSNAITEFLMNDVIGLRIESSLWKTISRSCITIFILNYDIYSNLSRTFFSTLILLKIEYYLELKVEKFIGLGKLSFHPFHMEKCSLFDHLHQ